MLAKGLRPVPLRMLAAVSMLALALWLGAMGDGGIAATRDAEHDRLHEHAGQAIHEYRRRHPHPRLRTQRLPPRPLLP